MSGGMSMRVRTPGMLATVQDLGRRGGGDGAGGASVSGAADAWSLRVGNRLVGNADGAAGIEMTLVGGTLEFTRATAVVLAGAACDAWLERRDGTRTRLAVWSPVSVLPGDAVSVGAIGGAIGGAGAGGGGCRVYVCVMGGVRVPLVLGSAATQVGVMVGSEWVGGVGGIGGTGAPLRSGDVVECGPRDGARAARLMTAGLRARCEEWIGRRVLRVTRGPQWEAMSAAAREGLGARRRVQAGCDRRGVRVTPGFEMEAGGGGGGGAGVLATQPTAWGFVQAPGRGEAIVLGPDGPPTGGYAVVACVAEVDMGALGQVRPGDEIALEVVEVERARELLAEAWGAVDEELPRVDGEGWRGGGWW
jgi:urea carboxylase